MPFAKGNTLWKKSQQARKENRKRADQFIEMLATGGLEAYGDFMDALAKGEDILKPQKEFLDRMERWKDHLAAKRAAEDGKGNTVPSIVLPQELINKNKEE
jgi:ribosomal 50S subunit-associated protein YjgA (DUF615 family)